MVHILRHVFANRAFLFLLLLLPFGCSEEKELKAPPLPDVYIQVLGIAQDAGYPQIACSKSCCEHIRKGTATPKHPVSLAIIDRKDRDFWLLECSPAVKHQLEMVYETDSNISKGQLPAGIFPTHAHIGHYTGLMHFGREALGAKQQQVYCLPKMDSFLRGNGPWDQMIALENIRIIPYGFDSLIPLNWKIQLLAVKVPHRDEYSETAGFVVKGPSKKLLFIPDIDKWNKWQHSLPHILENVDFAFIDGTFFANGELPGRDMTEIPHPFVTESMDYLSALPANLKAKVHFIHFNHTNPLIRENSKERETVIKRGFKVAAEGMIIPL